MAARSSDRKTFVSQNQTPIEYRLAKKLGPTSVPNLTRSSALSERRLTSYEASSGSCERERMLLTRVRSAIRDGRDREVGRAEGARKAPSELAEPRLDFEEPDEVHAGPRPRSESEVGRRAPPRSRSDRASQLLEPLQRPDASAADCFLEKPPRRALVVLARGMPQVEQRGLRSCVAAPQAEPPETHSEVDVLIAPSDEPHVDAVDGLEVSSRDSGTETVLVPMRRRSPGARVSTADAGREA